MDKWEKTLFWIVIATIGILLIGSLLGFNLRGLIGIVILIDMLLVLDTSFLDMKGKWKAFGLKSLILFVTIIFIGFLFKIPDENIGSLMGTIIMIEFIQTIFRKQ